MDAFAWQAAGTKHVVYGSSDGHVHELTWRKGVIGSSWRHADLTAETGAPIATDHGGKPTRPYVRAFEWPEKQAKQVLYFSQVPSPAHGHEMHELWMTKGGSWKHASLTELTGALAAWSPVTGYPWEAGHTKQYVYPGFGGHVLELYVGPGGVWKKADLTKITGALLSNTAITAYQWRAAGTKQVAYVREGHVHELYVAPSGTWKDADLTALAGGPDAGSRVLVGFEWAAGESKQVVYEAGYHVRELSIGKGGAWRDADLTALTGAPDLDASANFHAFAWEAGKAKQVVFENDGDVHELYVTAGGSWKHANLTKLTGSPPHGQTAVPHLKAFGFEAGAGKSVVYFDDFGNLHELSVRTGGKWAHTDLMEATGAPQPF
ncbi:MAG: hypothetical protein M3273_01870 [Actinomycetota bacterium]|nr:hypothetical protein [Actinomycetota bacterium]